MSYLVLQLRRMTLVAMRKADWNRGKLKVRRSIPINKEDMVRAAKGVERRGQMQEMLYRQKW